MRRSAKSVLLRCLSAVRAASGAGAGPAPACTRLQGRSAASYSQRSFVANRDGGWCGLTNVTVPAAHSLAALPPGDQRRCLATEAPALQFTQVAERRVRALVQQYEDCQAKLAGALLPALPRHRPRRCVLLASPHGEASTRGAQQSLGWTQGCSLPLPSITNLPTSSTNPMLIEAAGLCLPLVRRIAAARQ